MKHLSKNSWHDIKLSMFWIGIFTMLVATLAICLLLQENRDLTTRIGICQHNFEQWEKQVKSGRIILELETKGGENK